MNNETTRDINNMKMWVFRLAQKKWGLSSRQCAELFRNNRLFELINYVNDQSTMRITTGNLNSVLADAQTRVQPPTDKGRRLKIYYMTQVGVKPPHFVVFCNDKKLFHFSYRRYLENQIRSVFGLEGTPVIMTIREKGEEE